jgi:uncharacterized alkaline shock family protein YloU
VREESVDENLGKVTIAPNVLVTIVQKTADSVDGVAQLCDKVSGVKHLLGLHTVGRGVEANVMDDQVTVDVYLIARRGVDLLQMGRCVQREVTRDIEHIVGMKVHEVNVHIEDIATELSTIKDTKKGQNTG